MPDGDECRRRFYFAFAGLVPGAVVDSAPQKTIAAAGRPTGSRPLVVAPVATASSSPGSESAPPSARTLLASISLGPSHPIECDQNGRNCVAIAFTGPSADVLIRDLRDGGGDKSGAADGAAADSPSADGGGSASPDTGNSTSADSATSSSSDASSGAASTSPGNGKGKGKGHGNGHGKGPG